MEKIAIVLVNWNGREHSLACIEHLRKQSFKHTLIVVDNGSMDGFVDEVKHDSDIILLENEENLGFAGGVNTGIRYALQQKFQYIALINNDAVPDKEWLSNLVDTITSDEKIGIVDSKLLQKNGKVDSIGLAYTSWGLAYPLGRDEKDNKDSKDRAVFAGSGGACLLSAEMLREIGLYDEDFFAYYEDVDLGFRANLAGWNVIHNPKATVIHEVGASSSKIPDFTTYMTIKNLPWLFWKNVPLRLMPTVLPRFIIAHTSIVVSSLLKGAFIPVVKGLFMSTIFLPKKLLQRYKIQSTRQVDYLHIMSLMTYDLPPNAHKLKQVRSFLRRLRFWR